MSRDEQEDTTIYKVVVNHEEQYAIWPVDRENPLGWQDVRKSGLKQECLDYIEQVWTDMRPLSLRKQMEEAARRPPPAPPREATAPSNRGAGDPLVSQLSEGDHAVVVGLGADKSALAFKESLDRGYVYIRFTETRGGTELGLRVDRDRSDFSQADFANATGTAHVVGGLTLNYVPVRCVADIDLATRRGRGHLEPL